LLNIGPKGDGSIPQESIESMRTIGQWMAANGEAIYGTTASPFERPSWGRYTRKTGKLYVHVFQWPKNGTLHIHVGQMNVTRVYLLADLNRTLLNTDKRHDTLIVHIPGKAPDDIIWKAPDDIISVVVIEHQ
ncbi:MAG: alpha-L-fucosidase, partial [Planctomycetota bacterium]|jgi:alpha-L-fucosidase